MKSSKRSAGMLATALAVLAGLSITPGAIGVVHAGYQIKGKNGLKAKQLALELKAKSMDFGSLVKELMGLHEIVGIALSQDGKSIHITQEKYKAGNTFSDYTAAFYIQAKDVRAFRDLFELMPEKKEIKEGGAYFPLA